MTTKNTSVALGQHFDRFITEQVAGGRYTSAGEVIRAALRLIEKTDTKVEEPLSDPSKHDQNETSVTKTSNNTPGHSGSSVRRVLLSDKQIKSVKQSLEAGKSKNQLAQEYGVSVMAISRAARARIPRDRSHLKKSTAG